MTAPVIVLFAKKLNPYPKGGSQQQQGWKADCDVFVGVGRVENGQPYPVIPLEGTGVNNEVHAVACVGGTWSLTPKDGPSRTIEPGDFIQELDPYKYVVLTQTKD